MAEPNSHILSEIEETFLIFPFLLKEILNFFSLTETESGEGFRIAIKLDIA